MKNAVSFEELTSDILGSDIFRKSLDFIQHGKISVYAHSVAVARLSFSIGILLNIKDLRGLTRAALLHDFFLYDWHDEWKLDHGFTHPVTATKNAKTYFNVSEKEYSLILSHMWPFTFFHPPRYREGWIICLADKIRSIHETLFCR
jgi:uncharacterized protein